MPARVIRAEINSSDSLSRVSLEADLTFRALIVAVDDYGRCDGRLAAVKASLFPMRESITTKKLDGWLAELEREGCILRYVVDGRPYIALCGWETHRGKARRAESSRFPGPPERSQEYPRISGKSDDEHEDPSEGRGTRDENRESGDEGREGAAPAAPELPLPATVPDDLVAEGGIPWASLPGKRKAPADLSDPERRYLLAWCTRAHPSRAPALEGYIEALLIWGRGKNVVRHWVATIQGAITRDEKEGKPVEHRKRKSWGDVADYFAGRADPAEASAGRSLPRGGSSDPPDERSASAQAC